MIMVRRSNAYYKRVAVLQRNKIKGHSKENNEMELCLGTYDMM